MALPLFLVFVVAPLAELAVLIQVGGAIGVLNTIGLLILVSLVGTWLAKREGLGVLRRVRATIARGELPSREVADGALILLAGALMIAPGFISDALLPPTRALVRAPLVRWAVGRGRVTVVRHSRWGDAEVWDVDSWEEPARPSLRPELGEAHD